MFHVVLLCVEGLVCLVVAGLVVSSVCLLLSVFFSSLFGRFFSHALSIFLHGYSTTPPNVPPPPRNKGLIRPY